ncbi:MAG TPA: uridine kinase [Pseudonocardia sp.]|jgi:hypothetical protein|nr:uridine kinase [Pseudonocardia sp.]
MRVRPVRAAGLVDELAERIEGLGPGRRRVLVDGPPPARPGALADQLAGEMRVRGRPTVRASAADFLRPASLRLEHGRNDPDELLDGWLDESGLTRELLEPAGRTGHTTVLARLWDAEADRAYREPRLPLPPDNVLLVDGALLLGRGLPADMTVYLRLTQAALARTLPTELHWTLPAYRRYEAERDPSARADVLVLADDPHHLAVVDAP